MGQGINCWWHELSVIDEQVAALNRGEVKPENLRPPYLMATKESDATTLAKAEGLPTGNQLPPQELPEK